MRQLARDRSGETAAEKGLEEIQSEYDQAAERIARFRAQTLDGVLAKLAFIARTLDVQSWTEKGADGGSHEAILYSDRGGPQGDRARCLTARACGARGGFRAALLFGNDCVRFVWRALTCPPARARLLPRSKRPTRTLPRGFFCGCMLG